MRVGNVVTVSGHISIDPTSASTQTVLLISLPIATNFTASFLGLAGVASTSRAASAYLVGIIETDFTNDVAQLSFFNDADVSNVGWVFHFTYEIL